MVGYIYLITDTTNGMKYAGKHHYHIEGQLDPNYHGSGTIIKNIYKKRPETLKEEYIKTCYSEEEMCSDEQYYIKLFKTLWPNGYNLTEGGDGCVACEETRKKISEANKGKPAPNKGVPMSEEQKKKISESLKELFSIEKHPMFGKHHSDETRRKISDAKKGEKHPMFGKHHSDETKKKLSKKVLQFTLNGEFVREWPSTREIERQLGFDHSTICKCCNGKQKSAYGFKWCYAEE